MEYCIQVVPRHTFNARTADLEAIVTADLKHQSPLWLPSRQGTFPFFHLAADACPGPFTLSLEGWHYRAQRKPLRQETGRDVISQGTDCYKGAGHQ